MSSTSRCLVRGSINIDEFFHVQDIVRPGETISSTSLSKRAGGKGANQAVAVAKAGRPVTLVGAIGQDGISVKDNIAKFGVDVQSIEIVQEPTGRAIIQLAESGENSIILIKGANHATLPAPTTSSLESYTHMLLQNEIPFDATLSYLRLAKEIEKGHRRPIVVVYNPSPMPTPAQIASELRWDCIDWLLVNEGEAKQLLSAFPDVPGSSHTDLTLGGELPPALLLEMRSYLDILSQFASLPSFKHINIVCTLGPLGVISYLPFLVGGGRALYVPGVEVEKIVDTTGAGDCWTGYLVAGLMHVHEIHSHIPEQESLTVKEAQWLLERCNQAAGLCVEKNGAMESFPDGLAV